MTSLREQTLTAQVANLIEDLILDGTLKAGERLKEFDLEKRFGVSRTPLREAFRRLESQGLVETFPRRGTFVKRVSIREITEVTDIRVVLEALAVRLAHKKATPESLARLKAELDQMQIALEAKDNKAFINSHERYHIVLSEIADNTHLAKELQILRRMMRWHKFLFAFSENIFSYSLASHQLQFQMLSDPDADEHELVSIDAETTRKGCELLIEHIRKTMPTLPED